MRLPRRLFAPVLVALALLVAGCTDTYQVAASFGDHELSNGDLGDAVRAWQDSPELTEIIFGVFQQAPAGPGTDAAPSSALTSIVLTVRINGAAAQEIIADDGTPIDDALVTDIETELGRRRGTLSDAQLDQLVADLAAIFTLQELPASRVYDSVFVSDRYGSFDSAVGIVIPPEGPAPASLQFGL